MKQYPLKAGLLFSIITLFSLNSPVQACGSSTGGDPCGEEASNLVGSTSQSNKVADSAGNPINIITGNKFQLETDYQATGGLASLILKRFYNSRNTADDLGLGYGWRHSFEMYLAATEDQSTVQITQSDGRRVTFKRQGVNSTTYDGLSPQDGAVNLVDGKPVWSLNDGRQITFRAGLPIEIRYPGNKLFTLKYFKGHIRVVTDHYGRRLVFNYSEGKTAMGSFAESDDTDVKLSGHLESVNLPDGGVITYQYDADHNLSGVTYPDGTSRQYHYEDVGFPNHMTGITDRTGKRFATYAYNDEGRANLSTHANGVEKITLEYKIPEQVGDVGTTVLTNSLGQKSTYTWRFYEKIAQAILLSAEGPGCSTCPPPNRRYTYNNKYQIKTATDNKTGNITHYDYDKLGRTENVSQTISADSSERLIARYEYTGNSTRPALIARPSVNPDKEHVTKIEYDSDLQPISLTEQGYSPTTEGSFDPIERTTKLSYTNGNLTTIDGPRDDVQDLIQLTYNPQNRLQSLTQANGQTLKVTAYDINGRPTQIQKGEQSPLTLSYDHRGQVTSIKHRARDINYAYDKEGRLTQITSADGEVINMAYDDAGRLNTLNDDKGRTIQQLHDSESRPTQTQLMGNTGSVLNTISYLYDAQGRLDKTQTQNLDGDTETDYQYDDKGQLTHVKKNDQTVSLSYNNLGQLLGLTQPGEVVTQFSYDNKGQSNALTDARDNKTQTIKDDFGRTVQHISPDTGINVYTYDNAGNRIKRTDPENNVTTYQWNAGNQLINKQSTNASGASELTTYIYDSQTGKLASTTNPNTTESFQYNTEGQLIDHTREIDGHSFTTKYEYNAEDKLHKKHLPDGQTLRYHYYANNTAGGSLSKAEGQKGKLKAITRETLFGMKQENIISEIDNDKTDGESSYLSHNGLKTSYTFREDGQLQNIQIDDTLKLQYSYDLNGNITGIDENGTLQSYLYEQGRLTYAETLTGQYQYDYDKVGNRTTKAHQDNEGNETTENYTYPENGQGNRLTSLSLEGEGRGEGENKSYQYNKSGSPVNTDKYSYEYNSNQRPVKVFETVDSNKQLLAEYAYNSFGERIKKISYSQGKKAKVTYFLYDGHTLTAEIEQKVPKSGGVSFNQYIYLKHQPIAKLEQKQLYAIHSDHLGTPRLASNDDKQTVWKANYSPFGKAALETNKITLNLRLPGQYEDAETGTHYNYLRDYDPETGRYITSDPIGLKGGVNTYTYVGGDPLRLMDTKGLHATGEPHLHVGDPSPDIVTASEYGNAAGDFNDKYEGYLNQQEVHDGILAIPKPSADSEFVQKLSAVFDEAVFQLEFEGDQLLSDFVTKLKQDAPYIAGMMIAFAAIQFAPPPFNIGLDALFLGAAYAAAGTAAVNFLLKVFQLGVDIAATPPCDGGKLQSLGEQLALDIKAAGFEAATGAVLGGFSGVGKIAKTFKFDRNPEGSTRDEILDSTKTDLQSKSINWYEEVARSATKNPNSDKLVLGHFSTDGITYQKVAAHYQASYLKIVDWKNLTKGMSDEEVWKINETFLRQQVEQGKRVLFSHNPNAPREGSFFQREIEYLKNLGYSFKKINQFTWEAVLE